MSIVFTFADENTDFEKLKQQGIKAVLIKSSPKIRKTIKTASSLGMKIMVEITDRTKDFVSVIKPLAGRVHIEDGEIEYVSIGDIKGVIKSIGKEIANVIGFVLPTPDINGLLWNDDIKCNSEIDELYDLFDEEKEISRLRSRYYISAQTYILKTYMSPQNELLKKYGKKAVFHIGKKEMQYDLAGKLVDTMLLKRKGFCLGVCCHKQLAKSEFGLRGGDFVFDENGCEQIHQKRTPKNILLIKPTRGVIERYVETGKRNRLEKPALSGAIEGTFWAEKLNLKGCSFDVADEVSFWDKRCEKYKDILICESCLFTDKEMSKINKLIEKGVRINSAELMSELLKQGEEEWEK